jgi:preprotein translocase subunit SecG
MTTMEYLDKWTGWFLVVFTVTTLFIAGAIRGKGE